MSDVVRLDVWLDVACLFKTRSEAKRACEGGKVEVNGQTAKPNRVIREGDRLRIGRPYSRHQDIIVRIVLDDHEAAFADLPPVIVDRVERLRTDERAAPAVDEAHVTLLDPDVAAGSVEHGRRLAVA